MDLLKPNSYQESIYTINYQKLTKEGIKCLLFDLDNTCIPLLENKVNKKLIELFNKLKIMKLKIIIFSNATYNRLNLFKDKLPVDIEALCFKPSKIKFKKIMKKYNYKSSQIAIIGDQLFTDILGGNRVGIKTILINPLSKEDKTFTKILRKLEKKIMKKIKLKKGSYYE